MVPTGLALNRMDWASVESQQVTNNGGSSMKDAVDRIERTLAEHVETSAQRAVEMDARLTELEKQPT